MLSNFVCLLQGIDAGALSHAVSGVQLHGGRAHGVRAGLQARDRPVARRARQRAQRHARHIHTLRAHEGFARLLDAHDHQVQVSWLGCSRPVLKVFS